MIWPENRTRGLMLSSRVRNHCANEADKIKISYRDVLKQIDSFWLFNKMMIASINIYTIILKFMNEFRTRMKWPSPPARESQRCNLFNTSSTFGALVDLIPSACSTSQPLSDVEKTGSSVISSCFVFLYTWRFE